MPTNRVDRFVERWRWPIVAGLLLIFLVNCAASMRLKSATFDEVGQLPAGYHNLITGDTQLYWSNPPLMSLMAALPLAFMDLSYQGDHPALEAGDSIGFGRDFLYRHNDTADQMVFWGRFMMVLVGMGLGLVVFLWARRLFGTLAGLAVLALYSLDPNVLAYSRIVGADLGFAAFLTLSLFTFSLALEKRTWGSWIAAGVSFGLALAAKFSAIVLIPTYLLLLAWYLVARYRREGEAPAALLRWLKPGITGFLTIMGVGFLVIWATYRFELAPMVRETDDAQKLRKRFSGSGGQVVVKLASQVPIPARSYFISFANTLGFVPSLDQGERGFKYQRFLLGKRSRKGYWYFPLVALGAKTTTPLLILLLLALIAYRREDYAWLSAAWLPALLLFGLSMYKHAWAYRYVGLPILPLAYVFVAGLFRGRVWRTGWRRGVLPALLAWAILATARIYPHYLAFFNEWTGGPAKGYRIMVNSNLDWGQDLIGLKKFMDERGMNSIHLSYFGNADPAHHGIKYTPLRGVTGATFRGGDEQTRATCGPVSGYVAISATCLQNIEGFYPDCSYAWLKDRQPIAQIGYSIFVFYVPERPEEQSQGTGAGGYL